MKKTITAFISLGFCCCGPEMGEYGTFDVELSEEEAVQIDEVVKAGSKGYLRYVLQERYPELDEKIVDAAKTLVRNVCRKNGLPNSTRQATVCYYLTDTELPADYNFRTK